MAKMERSPEQRVRSLQASMNAIENKLGGGEGVEGLYGSISGVGMQRILDAMATSCGLDACSHLLDVGAGLCRPLVQALLTTELREATGVELDPVKCSKAIAFVKLASKAVQSKGLSSTPLPLPVVINLPIEAMQTLNTYTHAYSFWEGLPADARVGFGRLFATSTSLRSVTLVQRAVRSKDPALAMEEDYGFGPLTLVDTFSVKMNGSGRSFKAYIFNRDPSRPRPEPDYQPTLTPPLPLDHGTEGGSSELSDVDVCLPVPMAGPAAAAVFDAAAAAAQADALAGMGRGARRGCRSLTQAVVDSDDEEEDGTTAVWGGEGFLVAIPHKPVQQRSGKKRDHPEGVAEGQEEESLLGRRQQAKKAKGVKAAEEYVAGGRPRKQAQQKPRQQQQDKVELPPKAAPRDVQTEPQEAGPGEAPATPREQRRLSRHSGGTLRSPAFAISARGQNLRPSDVVAKIKNPRVPEKLVDGAVAGAVPAEEWKLLNMPRKGRKACDSVYIHLPTGYRFRSIPEVERFRGVRVPAPAAFSPPRLTRAAATALEAPVTELTAPKYPPIAAGRAALAVEPIVEEHQAVEEAGTLPEAGAATAPAATIVSAQPPVASPTFGKAMERFRGVRTPAGEAAAPAAAADGVPAKQLRSRKEKKAAPAVVESAGVPRFFRSRRAAPAAQLSSKSPSKPKRVLAALSPKKNLKKAARRTK